MEDPLDLHTPIPYRGEPGSKGEDAQPFKVVVERSCVAVMDLHAHLCRCEVIGYLAGRFECGTGEMCVGSVFLLFHIGGFLFA